MLGIHQRYPFSRRDPTSSLNQPPDARPPSNPFPVQFPKDAIERAQKYLASQPMGAYSNSQGIKAVREEIAAFIEARDGAAADPEVHAASRPKG